MTTYRALTDLFLPGSRYAQAGDTLTEGKEIPAGWIPPSGAVDPLDADAVTAYWNAGPGAAGSATPSQQLGPWFQGGRWTGIQVRPPLVYWTKLNGSFQLTGAGAPLGPWDLPPFVEPPIPPEPPLPPESVTAALIGDVWAVAGNSNLSKIVAGSQTVGTIAVSSDGGLNWSLNNSTLTSSDFTRDLMFVDDSQTVILCTPFNYLHRTTNLGASWTSLTAIGQHNWGSIAKTDDASKILVSSADASYLSTDQGATWTIRTNNAPNAQGYNYLVGDSTFSKIYSTDSVLVYVSTNLGQTWTALPNQPPVEDYFQGLYCSADGQIILLGDVHGNLARSTDGGTTWTQTINLSPISALNVFGRRVAGETGQHVLLSGNYFLAKSHDFGATWATDPLLDPFWEGNFTSPYICSMSINNRSLVVGTEYFNTRLLIRV